MNIWLSVIIPVYCIEKYIEKCLKSVVLNVKEVKDGVEVIIIDDGSTDSSGEIADIYAKKFDFVRVIHKENEGVAEARNWGLREANGKWIYFVDSDDWLMDNGFICICRCCRENPDADILMFDAVKNTNGKEETWEHFRNNMVWCDKTRIHELQRRVMYQKGTPLSAPWDKVYRKAFLHNNNIRFQKELKVLDDMVFNVEAFGTAEKIVYCKEKIYCYRYVTDSITNSYRPNRVSQDKEVWEYLQNYIASWNGIATRNEEEMLIQSFYCRVIKSFSICCRLCFFNPHNENSLQKKTEEVKKVLQQETYKEAFQRVKLKNAEWKLKVIILMGRAGMVYGIYLMHCMDMLQRNKRKG